LPDDADVAPDRLAAAAALKFTFRGCSAFGLESRGNLASFVEQKHVAASSKRPLRDLGGQVGCVPALIGCLFAPSAKNSLSSHPMSRHSNGRFNTWIQPVDATSLETA
jgi:hypothetical protein